MNNFLWLADLWNRPRIYTIFNAQTQTTNKYFFLDAPSYGKQHEWQFL